MSKYAASLGNLKNDLTQAKSVLIALPAELSPDKLAAGLALMLGLQQAGKQTSIVSSGSVKVSHTNLFGVDRVSNALPKVSGGDFVLSLEGVVDQDGSVAADGVDWNTQGGNLNLVFHIGAGKRFQPTRIVPQYNASSSNFDFIFCVGVPKLESLGEIYTNNRDLFSSAKIVNIGHDIDNAQYGQINVVDGSSPSTSEIVAQLISDLGLLVDGDMATNILTGIYDVTQNLTSNKVTPDTFMVVGASMQAGGRIPTLDTPVSSVSQTIYNQYQSNPAQQPLPEVVDMQPQPEVQSQLSQPQTPAAVYNQNFPPLNQVFGFPVQPDNPAANGMPVASSNNDSYQMPPITSMSQPQQAQSSQEERPMGEYAGSSNPEISNPDPNWLTPKIYKGGSAG